MWKFLVEIMQLRKFLAEMMQVRKSRAEITLRKSLAEITAFRTFAAKYYGKRNERTEERKRAEMRTVVSCPFLSPENSESCDSGM